MTEHDALLAAFKAFFDRPRSQPETVIVSSADREMCELLERSGYRPGPHIDPDVPEGAVTYWKPK